jgi:uncharacterized protein YqjF (DUF2071 family)
MTSLFVDRLSIRRRPRGLPLIRQWWGKLLFMHWPISPGFLRQLLPPQLTLDTFEGQAWIGVVPFTMWGVRPYFSPPVPGLNSFHELNVRTYVHFDGVPGVWFFSLDINSPLATWGARRFFFLPYYDAEISLRQEGQSILYHSGRKEGGATPATFDAAWTYGEPLPPSEPDSLAFFLTERYCLYTAHREQLYRCRIFHPPWPLRRAEVSAYNSTMVAALGLPEPSGEPLLHYADSLKIDIWPLARVARNAREPMFETAHAPESLG